MVDGKVRRTAEAREHRGNLLLRGRDILLRRVARKERAVRLVLGGDAARQEPGLPLVLALLISQRALSRPQVCLALAIRGLERLDREPRTCELRARVLHGDSERPLVETEQQLAAPHALIVP